MLAVLLTAILHLDNRLCSIEESLHSFHTIDMPPAVDEGAVLVKGLERIRTDDEKMLRMQEMARQKHSSIYTGIKDHHSFVDTGGDLIPQNLTDEERNVLKMFYSEP